jgi:transcriptional antiterminator RfaH
VKTQPRREAQVNALLDRRGIEVYSPQIPSWRRRPGESVPRLEPLFPGYLFARLELGTSSWIAARSAPGVAYFLGTTGGPEGSPTPLPDELIDGIRERVETRRQAGPIPFKQGDRVIIMGGPFDGLEAAFDGALCGSGRVRVFLELVKRLVPVDLYVGAIRPAREPAVA